MTTILGVTAIVGAVMYIIIDEVLEIKFSLKFWLLFLHTGAILSLVFPCIVTIDNEWHFFIFIIIFAIFSAPL